MSMLGRAGAGGDFPFTPENVLTLNGRAIGIDTASIDRGASVDFRAHRAFANANTPIFENLTNLGALPAQGAVFIGLPMKIGGGSGGPLRAVALLP